MAKTVDVTVPDLGESVTEATIASWVKQDGDKVEADETILELETDKVTLEVNAPSAGTLTSLKVAEGDTVTPGDVVAGIAAEGAAGSDAKKHSPQKDEPEKREPEKDDSEKEASKENSAETRKSEHSGPAARKQAAEKGIPLSDVAGSGKDGRVTKGDVLAHRATPTSGGHQVTITFPEAPRQGTSAEQEAHPREERVKMTRLRQTIAARLKEAQDTAAMLTTFNEVDMSQIMAARKRYQKRFVEKHDVKLGFMSFFVKACVGALREIPAINAQIDGTDIVYKNHYDIGVAVSTPNGLVVPVLRDADDRSFSDIEKTISDLGKRARDGKIGMKELQGGTFTITNGGIFGSLLSTPILNPPQSGILGMHKIQERPVAVDGSIEIRPMMNLALSYDHRIVDGREAVTFLVRVKECIENPERLLFDV